jgi:hypothetical protein
MLVNLGRDHQAGAIGGDLAGVTGTATSTAATTLTNTGASFPTAGAGLAGHVVVAGSSAATFRYGVIISNTATVLTIGEWLDPASPGAAASTPAGTSPYIVLPGGAPAWYMALGTNTSAPAGADTLTNLSEVNNAGGGLNRKLATYAHTAGAASYTLTAAYTANASDSATFGVAIHKIATLATLTPATGRIVFETVLNADATLNVSGDQLTVTQTVTLS